MKKNICLKCGWEWYQRIPIKSAVCPNCSNPRWDRGPKLPVGRPKKEGGEGK